MIFFRGWITLIAFGIMTAVKAQDSTLIVSGNVQASLSSSQTPFWLRSNVYGSIPEKGSFVNGQWSIYKNYSSGDPRIFQWSAGSELVTNLSQKPDIFFTDLFAAMKLGPIELSVGNRKSKMGLGGNTLGMGSVAMSENARPYPKIQISSPDFFNVIPGHTFLKAKFNYADGLIGGAPVVYGNTNYVSRTYLHQKSLYFQIGKETQKLNFLGGFNHQAMWGGEQEIFSGGLKPTDAYRYVVLGKPWDGSRVGNHFGSIDIAGSWSGKKWDLFLYRQTIYEDGSLSNLSSISDGLSGIRFKKKNKILNPKGLDINTIVLEMLYTKNQGGSVFDFSNGIFGNDNYFNHYVYSQGWSYRRSSLGTPFISPTRFIENEEGPDQFTINNRLIAMHLGTCGQFRGMTFLFKGSWSQNFGTYTIPFSSAKHQTSLLLKLTRPLSNTNKTSVVLTLAGDFGNLYPNSQALSIGFRKSGFIK